jgi:hypothetical protein
MLLIKILMTVFILSMLLGLVTEGGDDSNVLPVIAGGLGVISAVGILLTVIWTVL